MSQLSLRDAIQRVDSFLDANPGPNRRIPLIKFIRTLWDEASGDSETIAAYRRTLDESVTRIRDLERDLELAHEFAMSILRRKES